MLVFSVLAYLLWIADVAFHRVLPVHYRNLTFNSKLFYNLAELDRSVSANNVMTQANNVYGCFSLSK